MMEQKILKAVLMLRRLGNTYQSKEEQIAEQRRWMEEDEEYAERFDKWVDSMRYDLSKTPEERQEEHDREFEEFLEREAEYDRQHQAMYSGRERDEWDDLWDDRARECGAVIW